MCLLASCSCLHISGSEQARRRSDDTEIRKCQDTGQVTPNRTTAVPQTRSPPSFSDSRLLPSPASSQQGLVTHRTKMETVSSVTTTPEQQTEHQLSTSSASSMVTTPQQDLVTQRRELEKASAAPTSPQQQEDASVPTPQSCPFVKAGSDDTVLKGSPDQKNVKPHGVSSPVSTAKPCHGLKGRGRGIAILAGMQGVRVPDQTMADQKPLGRGAILQRMLKCEKKVEKAKMNQLHFSSESGSEPSGEDNSGTGARGQKMLMCEKAQMNGFHTSSKSPSEPSDEDDVTEALQREFCDVQTLPLNSSISSWSSRINSAVGRPPSSDRVCSRFGEFGNRMISASDNAGVNGTNSVSSAIPKDSEASEASGRNASTVQDITQFDSVASVQSRDTNLGVISTRTSNLDSTGSTVSSTQTLPSRKPLFVLDINEAQAEDDYESKITDPDVLEKLDKMLAAELTFEKKGKKGSGPKISPFPESTSWEETIGQESYSARDFDPDGDRIQWSFPSRDLSNGNMTGIRATSSNSLSLESDLEEQCELKSNIAKEDKVVNDFSLTIS